MNDGNPELRRIKKDVQKEQKNFCHKISPEYKSNAAITCVGGTRKILSFNASFNSVARSINIINITKNFVFVTINAISSTDNLIARSVNIIYISLKAVQVGGWLNIIDCGY